MKCRPDLEAFRRNIGFSDRCGMVTLGDLALSWPHAPKRTGPMVGHHRGKGALHDDAFNFPTPGDCVSMKLPSACRGRPGKKAEDVIWESALEVIRSSSSTLGENELSFKAPRMGVYEQSYFQSWRLSCSIQAVDSASNFGVASLSVRPQSLFRTELRASHRRPPHRARTGDVPSLAS